MEVVVVLVVLVTLILVPVIAFVRWQQKRRRAALLLKYGDEDIVDKIMQRMMWQGQTEEQLSDSLGSPESTDRKVLKHKVREIWKYNRQGNANRFNLRITLEDGVVVGWDKKGQ